MNGTRVMSPNAIPNWEISGFVEYIGSGQKQDDMILPVPEGARAVRLGNDATIRQLLSVTRKAYYSITFSAARTCAQAERLNVSVGPESGVLPIQTVYGSGGWDSFSFAFKTRHSTVWLTIHNPGVEEDPACGPLIDTIAIKALGAPRREKGNIPIDLQDSFFKTKMSNFRKSRIKLLFVLLAGNMLRNGDFEEGPFIFPDTAWGALVPPMGEDDVCPLPGWMVMSDTKVVKYVDAAHHAVPRGARAVELVAGREAALLQEVPTTPGRWYRLSFSVGDAGNGCVEPMVVEAYAARATARVSYESRGTGGSKRAGLEFAAAANLTRVVFQSYNHHTRKTDGTLCGPVLDDVALVSVRRHAARRLLL
jgi:hypothetical protein